MNGQKILIITSNYPRNSRDLIEQGFVYKMVNLLKNKNFDVYVLAPHSWGSSFKEDMDGIKIYRFPYFYPLRLQKLAYGLGGIPYNLGNSFIAKIQTPLFFISELISTIVIMKVEGIRTIYSHWLMPQGLVGSICKKFFDIYHVTTLHSSEITLLRRLPAGKKFAEFILENTDITTSVSAHRASELISCVSDEIGSKHAGTIKIVPMGVDTIELKCNEDRGKLKLKYGLSAKYIALFVGRLVEVKGCEYLIEGFKLLREKHDDVQLVIIGSGPMELKLKGLTEKYNLTDSVIFKGFIEHKKISEFYFLSDIFIIPSIIDSFGYEEGLPLVLLEALSTGKSIIATNTRGVKEVIVDNYNGILVEPKNSRQIAEGVSKLLSNPSLRKTLSTNARNTARKYEWNVIIEEFAELLERKDG